MKSPTNCAVIDISGKTPFGTLIQRVFSLDPAIEWVALEEAGREPRWAWRDPETGRIRVGTTTGNALLADPLMLMLAEKGEDADSMGTNADLGQLLFIVLSYVDLVQIVAHFGNHAHISVALAPGKDACALGTRLVKLLRPYSRRRTPGDIDGPVPA
jgi:hypothetical protein